VEMGIPDGRDGHTGHTRTRLLGMVTRRVQKRIDREFERNHVRSGPGGLSSGLAGPAAPGE
jgi:hypothetical protein